jgi:hypothetical protein
MGRTPGATATQNQAHLGAVSRKCADRHTAQQQGQETEKAVFEDGHR